MAKTAFKGNSSQRDPLVGTFGSRRERPHYAISILKKERTYKQAKQILNQIRIYHLESIIYFNTKKRPLNDILDAPTYPRSSNWIQELGWLTHAICDQAQSIRDFLKKRKAFGVAFLLGRYDSAVSILDEIVNDYGQSFWAVERQLMLHEYKEGFESHKKHLAHLQKQLTDPIIGYILTMLSNRLESHVTRDTFYASIGKALSELRETGHELIAALIEMQVSPWTFQWAEERQEMLYWCGGRPLIDRYNTAVKILSYATDCNLSTSELKHLSAILGDLYDAVEDPQLQHIFWSFFGEAPKNNIDALSDRYFAALDSFVLGDFKECIQATEALLIENPASFDVYKLLASASACFSGDFTVGLDGKSLAWRILTLMQEIARNRTDLSLPFIELKEIALKLGDNHLGISLWQFAQAEFYGDASRTACHYALVQSRIHSLGSFSGPNTQYRSACLNELQKNYTNHPSLKLCLYLNRVNGAASDVPAEISLSFANIARAENRMADEKYQDVLDNVLPILSETNRELNINRFLAKDAARMEFVALMALNKPIEAASAILKHYNFNPNIIALARFEVLIESGGGEKWPELSATVYRPILVFLNNGSEQDIYEALDDFLISKNLSSPETMLSHLGDLPVGAAKILLRDVLVPKVLARGALWAKTPEQQRQLRTKILQALYSISVEDQAFVVNELSSLDQARMLQDAYKNVEGPKFFLDFEDLNKRLTKLLEGTFERYCSYRAYEEKGGHLVAEADLLESAKSKTSVKAIPEKSIETSGVLLENVASYIFIQYLWDSNIGVNATLSTRIRHGSLENQFKRVCGAHFMLATMDLDGNFQCEPSLMSKIGTNDPDKRERIKSAYITFTREINRIYEQLISVSLRIRVPEAIVALLERDGLPVKELGSDRGLIDFSKLFAEQTFTQLKSVQINSFNVLLTELLKIFTTQTEMALASVRHYLETTVAKEIDNALLVLDAAVISILEDGNQRVALRADILAVKDEFVHDLRVILTWFSIATKFETGIVSLKELIETAGRVVNFASNGKLGRLTAREISNDAIQANTNVPLYEVLSILLRNVVQHSHLDVNQEVEYSFAVNARGKRILTMTNRMPTEEACSTALRMANQRISQPADPRVLERAPGGTGLARIPALLKQIGSDDSEVEVISDGARKLFTVRITY